MTKSYSAKDVRVLQEVEHIRLNPGMYIGDTSNPSHLIEEALDNALDEALAGHAKIIAVMVDTKENRFAVLDDGRGIPVDEDTPITISSKLFSGAKFQDKKTAYEISSGLHGVGLVAVNALSTEYKVEIYRDNQFATYLFENTKLKKKKIQKFEGQRPFSTKIEFVPDKKFFETTTPNLNRIRQRLTAASAEMPEDISFVLYIDGEKEIFKLSTVDYFKQNCLTGKDEVEIYSIQVQRGAEKFNVLFTYEQNGRLTPKHISSVNLLPVTDGGVHLNCFLDQLKEFFQAKAKKLGYEFLTNDVLVGLRAYLSLNLREPKFSGQTKDRLINLKPDMEVFTKQMRPQIEKIFEQGDRLDNLLSRFQEYRKKLDSKKLVKTGTAGKRASTKFTKLRDCTKRDGELYIVEGDSAGGCCHKNTKIKLTDGRNLPISEIVKEFSEGKDNFIYAYDHLTNSIVIEKISNAIKTKLNANLVKVNIDNGEHIICTPDHKFMLRDGTYVEAINLKPGDSLMPLYTKIDEIEIKRQSLENKKLYYEMVHQQSGEYILTHWLSDEWNLRNNKYGDEISKFHRHHIDKNSLNNNPDNIWRMTKSNHIKLHNEDSVDIKQTPEYREYMSSKIKEQSEQLSERAKKQWEDETYKQYMVEKWKEFYNSNEEYREQNKQQLDQAQKEYWSSEENRQKQAETTRKYFEEHPEEVEKRRQEANEQWKDEELRKWRSQKTKEQFSDSEMKRKKIDSEEKNRLYNCMLKIKELGIDNYTEFRKSQPRKYMKVETIVKKFFNDNIDNFGEAIDNYNHKVTSVEILDYKDDVYDIEVPNYHNFATSAGVFIHNSIIQTRDAKIHAVLPLRGKSIPNATTKKDILNNKEVKELIMAIGAGVGPHFDITKVRYNKIICATDADHDGSHIACLVSMAMAILLPDIVKAGMYYIAQTPLYAINEKKTFIPLWSEDELEKARKEGKYITRFKGLGELSPHQLKICLLDEETRHLTPVEYSENIEELEKLFSSAAEKRKLVGD